MFLRLQLRRWNQQSQRASDPSTLAISIEICDVLSLLSRGHIFPETLVTAMPKTRDASVERNRELVLDGKRIKKKGGGRGEKNWKTNEKNIEDALTELERRQVTARVHSVVVGTRANVVLTLIFEVLLKVAGKATSHN